MNIQQNQKIKVGNVFFNVVLLLEPIRPEIRGALQGGPELTIQLFWYFSSFNVLRGGPRIEELSVLGGSQIAPQK